MAIRIPNPTYIPNNAASISFDTPKLIIFISDRKIIVATRPMNETAMPATTFSVLFLAGLGDMRANGYADRSGPRLEVEAVCLDLQVRAVDVSSDDIRPFQLVPDRKVQRLADLVLTLAFSETFLDRRI